MSSRELDERNEAAQNARIAEEIGINVDDLNQLEWRIEDNISNDGLLYGHHLYIEEGSDPEVLKRLGWSIDDNFEISPMVD